MGSCSDARAPVNVDADVVVVRDQRLTRVQTHPHADRRVVGPRVLREPDLRVGRSRDRAGRIGEGHEEAIALRVDDAAAVLVARLAHEPPVLRQNLCVAAAELVQQARRPLDVGKEKGDCAGREFAHWLKNLAPAREMEGARSALPRDGRCTRSLRLVPLLGRGDRCWRTGAQRCFRRLGSSRARRAPTALIARHELDATRW